MSSDLSGTIQRFARTLPYKVEPYSKRNWGHPLHSLCSYQGKLKPALAHWLVELFTEPGMTVLDPLGGIGTIAFEACCQGRIGISNDLSPLAYAVATGKVTVPSSVDVDIALRRLANGMNESQPTAADFEGAQFGLNGSVADFYHAQTLEEILRARRYFLALNNADAADLFVKACLLHVLHGNRPYALSRTSHPITPFHPSGEAVYKPVLEYVRRRASLALKYALPDHFRPGISMHGSYLELPHRLAGKVDRIITSPPFLGMRFDRPNWLRLWFCGWSAENFHRTGDAFLERQQTKSLDVYRQFFDVCADIVTPTGLMILHLGGSDTHRMVEHLASLATEHFDVHEIVREDVTKVERHGIRDKGLTTTHEFVFARPRHQGRSSISLLSGRLASASTTRAKSDGLAVRSSS